MGLWARRANATRSVPAHHPLYKKRGQGRKKQKIPYFGLRWILWRDEHFFSKFFLEINSIDILFMAQKNIFLQLSFLYLPGMRSKRRQTFFYFPNLEYFADPRLFRAKKVVENQTTCLLEPSRLLGGDEHFILFIFFLSEVFKMVGKRLISTSNILFFCCCSNPAWY